MYIYIIYTPNLGFKIAVPGRERKQGRFRGSIEEAGREYEGVGRGYRETRESIEGREHYSG